MTGCRVNGADETDDDDLGLWCDPTSVNVKRGRETLGQYSYHAILPRLRTLLDDLIAIAASPSQFSRGAIAERAARVRVPWPLP